MGWAAVVLAARRADALEETAKECERFGGQALAVPTDVADVQAVEELARRAVERFGRIDVWANRAAVTVFGPFSEVPLENFRRVLEVNVMGYVHGAQAALPYLRDQGRGVVVNVSSLVGVVSQPYVRSPRREVVVGAMGRNLVKQSKLAPGLTERMMAVQVDRAHLSRKERAPATSGDLYEPAPGSGSVEGGWHGRRKTAVRRTATAAAMIGLIVGARRVLR
ncbi:SDR family NAD(P)-dependent oxidoreductase [Nonomuraea dietziae]|uniref:SDR family NAD(P)-dependent oxidoreductase n=1 Tax=Nonomuraea dietziae TaxID=65515 RepID=UPI0033F0EAF7